MFIIFCEECGSRNVIEDKTLKNIGKQAVPCQVCSFKISTKHLIDHTGARKVIDTSTCKLLIIDDDQAHLTLLQNSLRREYTVLIANSGEQGIEVATTQDPDLILLDVNMPGLDGYEVCSRLKGDSSTRHIPVIFVTAQAEGDHEYKGLALGAVDYIFKPFSLKVLNAKIAAHLKYNAMRDELRKQINEQKKTIDDLKQYILDGESGKDEETKQKGPGADGPKSYVEQEKDNLVNILNTLRDVITIQNMDKKIIWANKAAMKNFKATFSGLQGKICYKFYYDREAPCDNCFFKMGSSKKYSEPVEVDNKKLGLTFLQTNIPLYDSEGRISGVACTAQKTIEVDHAEPEKFTKESLSTLKKFLASRCRELNEVTSTILVSSDAICNMYKDDKKILQLNEYLADDNLRLRAIVNELKNRIKKL